jgi:hypothetical protein
MDNNEIWERIAAPLDKKQIKTRWQKGRDGNKIPIRYISRADVIYRLNQVCPGDWNFRVDMISTPLNGGGWVAKGSLTICGVTREDFGVPEQSEYFDPPKAAASDALKRCASQFGFAIELYADEPEAPADPKGDEGKPPASPNAPEFETPAGNPVENDPLPTDGPKNAWISDGKERAKFWAETKERGWEHEAVHEALGVTSLKLWTGSREEALDALDARARLNALDAKRAKPAALDAPVVEGIIPLKEDPPEPDTVTVTWTKKQMADLWAFADEKHVSVTKLWTAAEVKNVAEFYVKLTPETAIALIRKVAAELRGETGQTELPLAEQAA